MCRAATVLYIALWIESSLHPSPDRIDLDLKLELPEQMVTAPELIDRGGMPRGRAAERPEDAPGDVPGDVSWGRTAGRAKGTRYG
eukprot:6328241-Pyramimonas_sp.AAC.1